MKAIVNIIVQLIEAFLAGYAPKASTGPSKGPWSVPSLKLIKEFEGLRLQAYLCPAKVWTIGYGHTRTVERGDVISQARAEALLAEDVAWVKDCVDVNVEVRLNANQVAALYSFIYNIGATAFFKSTMLRKLNKSDYEGAASEFKRWNKGGGVRLNGLVRRRVAEANLFRKPV